MGVIDNLRHQKFRVEYSVVFGYHSPRCGEDGGKHSEVENYGTMRGYLKIEENVGFNDCRE
jgi:hypothetical protein